MKTALFVDFDNVYLGLKRTDPRAAEVFAAQPARWLSWLESNPHGRIESGSPPRTANGRRDTLVRKCYLNPRSFSGYRHHFVCSAFEVIDCPPMTSHAKNGSDIRMVMDILDTLQHPTRFDEFMILSGDADFTPVLLRLRAYDRRTTVLAVSHAAEAYRAACHWVIAESLFIRDALGIGPLTLPPLASILPQPVLPAQPALPAQAAQPAPAPGPEHLPSDIAAPPSPPPAASVQPAPSVNLDDLKRGILACVQKLIAESPKPVELAVAAQAVMRELGPSVLETRWAGAGRFKSLLR
ncbi:MAG TPA: NYN domain-containing protein, partial [Archangium sp.]|nr:NYN domain-containing protein [Archangium sp.]